MKKCYSRFHFHVLDDCQRLRIPKDLSIPRMPRKQIELWDITLTSGNFRSYQIQTANIHFKNRTSAPVQLLDHKSHSPPFNYRAWLYEYAVIWIKRSTTKEDEKEHLFQLMMWSIFRTEHVILIGSRSHRTYWSVTWTAITQFPLGPCVKARRQGEVTRRHSAFLSSEWWPVSVLGAICTRPKATWFWFYFRGAMGGSDHRGDPLLTWTSQSQRHAWKKIEIQIFARWNLLPGVCLAITIDSETRFDRFDVIMTTTKREFHVRLPTSVRGGWRNMWSLGV